MDNNTIVRNNLITPAGYKKLVDEYDFLQKEERPRIVEDVHHAAKLGDRSENAEYIYGKKRLREIDSRLRFLEKKINIARIINPKEQKGDVVLFGATVHVENDDGIVKVWQIVGEDEFNVSQGKISYNSPVSKALLKKKVNDLVDVETPKGLLCYTILKIEYK